MQFFVTTLIGSLFSNIKVYPIMWSIFKLFFQPKQKLGSKSCTYYTGPELSLTELRQHLGQFKGGSIDLEKDDSSGIATLCINHYEKRNAISGKMMVDFSDAVTELEEWPNGKGLLMFGTNHTFCSGGDLELARQTSNAEDGFRMSVFMHNVLQRFQKLPLITVAVIEGAGALGGGAELAVACDFRLITESAKGLGFVHGRMGIAPAWGGATRLVKITGYRTALDLMATARIMSGKEAMKIGLVDEILSGDDVLTEAKEWLSERTKHVTEVVRATKMIALNAQELGYNEALKEERRIFAPLWGGIANQEALKRNIKHRL